MHKKILLSVLLAAGFALAASGQEPADTSDIYRDRADSLEATVFVARQKGNTLSKYTPNRVETITAAGLCKMACCNLAESFENSASVTVGYSDAVTGARQIRLLGLSGIVKYAYGYDGYYAILVIIIPTFVWGIPKIRKLEAEKKAQLSE